ncbi:exporter of polyketide antibiotics [Microtetraspora sp. NBRC 13810]|uniref:ABC transporter permease n=1 Tax=Microtetraspora sp. NBRC 13810 TaxID=3030990 RepID=UPI0024A4EA03|nr:hypothetical protein [Microtetraspora sp. NBRC 13810]GLW09509.1 exporter of polyketide antibiotics [Microtetraspora sp. NBRC 13810]
MSTLTGTGSMVLVILRRDRVKLLAWFGLVALIVVGVASAVGSAYPTEAARRAFAATTNGDPAQLFMIGPIYDTSAAGLGAWRVRGQAALLLGLATLLLVVRNTRGEEESGRAELLGSTVVGRHASLTATLTVAFCANLVTAALVTLGLAAVGFPVAGSLLAALSFAACGWVMAGTAALAAQLTGGARAAAGIASAVMAAWYVLRGVADAGPAPWASWLSPFGWAQGVRPFAGDHVWPLLPVAGAAVLLTGAAYLLAARRDLGAGLLPDRPGPAAAAPGLRGPFALAWRQHRGMLVAWTAGTLLLGAALGGTAQGIARQLGASDALRGLIERMGGGARPVDGFFATIVYLAAQVLTIYAIEATLRPHAEETAGRAAAVLAGPVGRVRWAAGHLAVAALGSVVVLAGLGLGIGVVYGLTTGTAAHEVPRLLAAALVRAPSVLVLAALAAALYGVAPRLAAPVTYTVLGGLLALELAVELGGADASILSLSPFARTPALPGAAFTVTPLLWLAAVAAALTAAGLFALRRRDLTG